MCSGNSLVMNYHSVLCKSPEGHSSWLLCGKNLKSCTVTINYLFVQCYYYNLLNLSYKSFTCFIYIIWYSSSSSSSSSRAQQPLLGQDLQKLLPAVPIPCSIPPVSLPQLPAILCHTILPSQFRPTPLSSSFYHCNKDSSCRTLFLYMVLPTVKF